MFYLYVCFLFLIHGGGEPKVIYIVDNNKANKTKQTEIKFDICQKGHLLSPLNSKQECKIPIIKYFCFLSK